MFTGTNVLPSQPKTPQKKKHVNKASALVLLTYSSTHSLIQTFDIVK